MKACPAPRRPSAALAGLAVAAATLAAPARAQLPPSAVAEALALATESATALAPTGARVLAAAGALDPRLRLAPCKRTQVHLPAGSPGWGRTRIGVRCAEGPTRWQVHLPVTVQVLAPAVVATAALPAGARLDAAQLGVAEVDWAAASAAPLADAGALSGRVLARPVAAGQALRTADLRPRLWFAAGDIVRIAARGNGFAIDAEGQALTPGREGEAARVRTQGGRVVTGRPVGERRLELTL